MIAASVYAFGPYRLNVPVRSLYRNDEVVVLPPKVLEVLILLVQRRGEIVEKEEFFKTVWPDSFVEESNLTQSVFVLRKILAEEGSTQTYIETIPKRGYRFAAEVRDAPESPESLPPVMPETILTAKRPGSRRYFLWTVCGGGLAAGVVAASRLGTWRTGADSHIVALAVLPFKNLSGDAGQDYLADGLTDSLTGELGKFQNLRVRSRTSAMRHKDSRGTVREIAAALGATALVEGSITRTGDRLHVVCQLIDAKEDSHIWSETYDRPIHDIPLLLSEIAGQVAREVRVRVSDDERRRIARKGSPKGDAFEAYLRGRYFLERGTAEAFKTALELFKGAIQADSAYAPAYIGLADCYSRMGSLDISIYNPIEARALATGAARQALEIDPDFAEAHAALAHARINDWEWEEAEHALRRSVQLNPSCVLARIWYSNYFAANGRFAEALQESNLALELDPLTRSTRAHVAGILKLARRFEEAIEKYQRLAQVEPNSAQVQWQLGVTYMDQGRAHLAIPPLEKAARLSKRSFTYLGFLGQAYAAAGRTPEALAILRELLELQRHRYVTPCLLALVNLSLKNREEFFRWFEKSYEERSNGMLWIKVEALYDPVRGDPRFRKIEDLIFRGAPRRG
jgi:DNA-binding winged helix-turn-helix (wHTH) protein/TolB-like protein/tetratricopeptide (TPR) repeat protein